MNTLNSKYKVFFENWLFRSRGFLIPYIAIFIAGLIWVLTNEKGAEVIIVNSFSIELFDKIFLFITYFGLGGFLSAVAAFLAIYNFRWSLLTFLSLGLVGMFSSFFKKIVFENHFRPLHYFYYDDFHRFLHDAPLIYYNSFPSGHTMAIFGVCSMMAYLSARKDAGFIFFVLALLVGFSRIYLLQHFAADVVAGSLLGILITFLTIYLLDSKLKIGNKPFFKKGLWNLVFPAK